MNLESVTIIIIGLNVIISINGFSNRAFFNRYKFLIAPIQSGDYIRLLSSGFLHVDYTHLFFNMFGLFVFASPVIKAFGLWQFVVLYLVALIAGSLLAYLYHRNNPNYSAVGASGAVSGVLYAYILLNPFSKLVFVFLPIVEIPAIVVGIGYLIYSVYGMKNSIGNIGHADHLGGAVMGLVMSLIYAPQLLAERTAVILILCVPIVLLFVLARKG